jgi:DNA helicase HerA-like ATPase
VSGRDKLAALRPPRPSVFTPFFRRWFTDERERELRETRQLYDEVSRRFAASAWAGDYRTAAAFRKLIDTVTPVIDEAAAHLPKELQDALFATWTEVIRLEEVLYEPSEWPAAMTMKEGVELRKALRAQEYFLANDERCSAELTNAVLLMFTEIARELPAIKSEGRELFTVPLVHLFNDLYGLTQHILAVPAQQACVDASLFTALNKRFYENLCAVSNVIPYTEHKKPFAWAKDSKLPPSELADAYLSGTPFHSLFHMPVPLAVTHDTFFSHMHVCGGTGAGKTQWLSTLIHHHLEDPACPALVVVDSQSDLINKLSRLEALKDRGILISPKDIRHPPAINVFDLKRTRLGSYDEVTREQVVAGAIDTFDYLFSGLVGADLTAKQSVFFRFVCRLLLNLPETMGRNATILDMIALMEDPSPYEGAIEQLPTIQRKFFERDFREKTFQQTKEQVRYRLNSILENPTMERLFTAPETRLDLFEELDKGSVILIDTAKDFLKTSSSHFGRLFISLVLRAIMERAAIPEADRKPAFLIVDEAAEYFDQNINDLLTQVRKYKMGCVFAHQFMDQCTQSLKSSLAANTAIKLASRVSTGDARALAPDMRTTPEFILSQPKLQFACYIRDVTSHAIGVPVEAGKLDRQPQVTDEAYRLFLERNRKRVSAPPAVPHTAREPRASFPREPTTPPKSASSDPFNVDFV